jgi:hypothetical protein
VHITNAFPPELGLDLFEGNPAISDKEDALLTLGFSLESCAHILLFITFVESPFTDALLGHGISKQVKRSRAECKGLQDTHIGLKSYRGGVGTTP